MYPSIASTRVASVRTMRFSVRERLGGDFGNNFLRVDCPLNMTEVDFPGYLLLRCSFWFKVDRGNQGEIYELTNSSIFDLTDDSTTEAQDTPISIGILVAGSKRDAAIFSPSRCILKRLPSHFGQDRKLVESMNDGNYSFFSFFQQVFDLARNGRVIF